MDCFWIFFLYEIVIGEEWILFMIVMLFMVCFFSDVVVIIVFIFGRRWSIFRRGFEIGEWLEYMIYLIFYFLILFVYEMVVFEIFEGVFL